MVTALIGVMLIGQLEHMMGPAPAPVDVPHFPSRLHAFVWRNWELVPLERMATVVGAEPEQIRDLGHAMGLTGPPAITEDQWLRSYITIIRRNWHLLSYDQLCTLLDWSPEHLEFMLREDDFLFIKLGNLKPDCEPLKYTEPDAEAIARSNEIAQLVSPLTELATDDPLFGFVTALSQPLEVDADAVRESRFSPRFAYSYFALYGDPLLEIEQDPFPDGYLARLAASGVDGVWLQGILYTLTPFPWDESLSTHWETRLENLNKLIARAQQHGIGVYLYLNEPRTMPNAFFEEHPDLKGISVGSYASMCTESPGVQEYIRNGVRMLCEAAPDLAGIFTITASENPTNCWSHYRGGECSRCAEVGPGRVIAGVNRLITEGIAEAGTSTRLIAWDWGWLDDWSADVIAHLPETATLQSVSEWSMPIERGGIPNVVGEYSLSTIGPGPRATRHWQLARERGLRTTAKVQANNTWELSTVPYIPAVENAARHAANLREADIDGLMLSWTLGGYPAPNLEVFAALGADDDLSPEDAMLQVARHRYGSAVAPFVVDAWKKCSAAFSTYPYDNHLIYNGPQQMGPANLLHGEPTGYSATMVCFPYDDLHRWRGAYPVEVFIALFHEMGEAFSEAAITLGKEIDTHADAATNKEALAMELNVMQAVALHFKSVSLQAKFIQAHDELRNAEAEDDIETAASARATLQSVLESETALASDLYRIQRRDSRMGFESSNHYFYVPLDLVEKVINCTWLSDTL